MPEAPLPQVDGDARSIHYEVTGDGPAVLLVPGIGAGAQLFGTLPRRFDRAGFRCLTVDPVGVAPSSKLSAPYDFDEAARDLLAILDDADVATCHLVGTSLGAKVALHLAHQQPSRISALVMLGSAAIPSPRGRLINRFYEVLANNLGPAEFAEAIAPFLLGPEFHRRRPQVVKDIIRSTRLDRHRLDLVAAQALALQSWDGTQLAEEIGCPCLCIAGGADSLTTVDEVSATADLMPNARMLLIPESGHSLLLESGQVFDAIVTFLSELTGLSGLSG
jgi:3-oxoadipate enol-lactonase